MCIRDRIKCLLSNCLDSELSGIVTIKIDNAEKVFDHLSEQNIICSLREGLIRFSSHFYNTSQEIDTVVDELQKI